MMSVLALAPIFSTSRTVSETQMSLFNVEQQKLLMRKKETHIHMLAANNKLTTS